MQFKPAPDLFAAIAPLIGGMLYEVGTKSTNPSFFSQFAEPRMV